MVYATGPSGAESSTPVTVTVCATFQLAAVNVTDGGATVPSATLVELSGIVTLATGWLVKTMVNVAVPPASVVTRPVVDVTFTEATSSSVVTTETSATVRVLKARSALVVEPVTIVYATVPSTTRSSTPVMVTVCATFQFAGVKVTEAGDTVPSVRSLELSGMVTSADGGAARIIVNVAVPPTSVT